MPIPLRFWIRAGIATGIADFLYACYNAYTQGSDFTKLWQGVASVPFGGGIREWGGGATALGVVLHFCVAFFWSGLLLLLVARIGALRSLVRSIPGAVLLAAIAGPLVWIAMSRGVIPMFVGRSSPITPRWWMQLAGHVLFVGLPMTLVARQMVRTHFARDERGDAARPAVSLDERAQRGLSIR